MLPRRVLRINMRRATRAPEVAVRKGGITLYVDELVAVIRKERRNSAICRRISCGRRRRSRGPRRRSSGNK